MRISLPIVVVGLVAGLSDPVMATKIIERDATTTLLLSGPSFNASTYDYYNVYDFDTTAGSYSISFGLKPNANSIVFTNLGTTTGAPTAVPDGTTSVSFTQSTPGGAGQGYTSEYKGDAATSLSNSFITYGTNAGHYTLAFSGGGVNGIDVGGKFLSTVLISGDFSSQASHSAVTYDPGYVVDQNFTYDAANNQTVFQVENDNYNNNSPSISFSLLGDAIPVPEPISLALLAVFSGGLVAHRRVTRGRHS